MTCSGSILTTLHLCTGASITLARLVQVHFILVTGLVRLSNWLESHKSGLESLTNIIPAWKLLTSRFRMFKLWPIIMHLSLVHQYVQDVCTFDPCFLTSQIQLLNSSFSPLSTSLPPSHASTSSSGCSRCWSCCSVWSTRDPPKDNAGWKLAWWSLDFIEHDNDWFNRQCLINNFFPAELPGLSCQDKASGLSRDSRQWGGCPGILSSRWAS